MYFADVGVADRKAMQDDSAGVADHVSRQQRAGDDLTPVLCLGIGCGRRALLVHTTPKSHEVAVPDTLLEQGRRVAIGKKALPSADHVPSLEPVQRGRQHEIRSVDNHGCLWKTQTPDAHNPYGARIGSHGLCGSPKGCAERQGTS